MLYKEVLEKNPRFIDWDLEVNNVPYQIIGYDGYNSEDYCCYPINGSTYKDGDKYIPMDDTIEVSDCYGIRGEAPTWEIKQEKSKYFKTKWGDSSLRMGCTTTVYRNGKPFFKFGGSEDYAYHKAKAMMVEYLEGPINFHSRFWKEELIGRNINYNGQAATIESIGSDPFYMWIEPVNGKFNPPPKWDSDDPDECLNREYWDEEYAEGLRIDCVLSESIDWYPKETS
tara:strand:- start:34215 stop:34895 length:681 start_codon:yes stop_codon:yes gene_type:complete